MIESIIISLLVTFIALYFLEGKIEVKERTHRLLAAISKWFRAPRNPPLPPPLTQSPLQLASQLPNRYPQPFVMGVACTLGSPLDERGRRGLQYFPFDARDGDCELAALGIANSGRVTKNGDGHHYFYFRFDGSIVDDFKNRPIAVIVEYFDTDSSEREAPDRFFGVAYDSSGGNGIAAIYKLANLVKLTGNNTWKTAVFQIDDGGFNNRQHGADFRICIRNVDIETSTELIVRRVAVVVME